MILLNEKSLEGQFESLDAFLDTLPVMNRNFKVLQEQEIELQKHSMFFQCHITKEYTLLDLRNNKGIVKPQERDKVKQWKRLLCSLANDPPYWNLETESREQCIWNGKDITDSSLAEAARRNTMVLSFKHTDFSDKDLKIQTENQIKNVKSCVTTGYLVDSLYQRNEISIVFWLKEKHRTGRLSLEYLDMRTGSVVSLEKEEQEELSKALDRFDEAGSWEGISHDRFFNYKPYRPASKEDDWFAHTVFRDEAIMKFRCGQHSKLRCFGYRKDDRFYMLRVERDHKVSDKG